MDYKDIIINAVFTVMMVAVAIQFVLAVWKTIAG